MLMNNIINKRNTLRELSDIDFEILLPKLVTELETHGILYENYSQEDILKDWESLKKKQVDNNITNIAATNVVGMKIMRKHMKHFHEVSNYKGVSIYSLWNKQNLEKALRFNRKNHSTPYASEIIRSLSFTNGLGKVTMYRPLMARNIVSYFNAKSVLDVCAGWGGRMLGTKSLGNNILYTGLEPCKKTYDGLCSISKELNIEEGLQLINEPAEKYLLELDENIKFDLALTSPPYYNLEIYSSENNQSLQYNDYTSWINNFLEPVIKNVIKRVKISCWSVKNFKTDKKYNLLDDVIRIHEENGCIMMDKQFRMSNSSRPGSSNTIKKTEEVTYVFITPTQL
uniref:site-specific DNA-methyltransferase (cytosine-N(4)-specific) n=1 Tax=viral metagenome TaxID=1070528 RepID=A0A6C0KMZ3_9ZZZZ